MIIDTHCHYNMDPLYTDWKVHLHQAMQKGVKAAVVVGTTVETSERSIRLARLSDKFLAVVGIHPSYASSQQNDQNIAELSKLLKKNEVAAIGETGIDFFRNPAPEQRAAQKKSFIDHIKLANEHKLPLIVHVRDTDESLSNPDNAYYQTLELLETHHRQESPIILHCISGPKDYLEAVLEMGAYIGVAGNVTYKKSDHLRELVKMAPKDKILTETDAPFLPPQDFRGKTCEPWMISETVDYLQTELSLNKNQLFENALTVFPMLNATITS